MCGEHLAVGYWAMKGCGFWAKREQTRCEVYNTRWCVVVDVRAEEEMRIKLIATNGSA